MSLQRNPAIINETELVLSFWDLKSGGIKDSIDKTLANNKKSNVYKY